METIEEIHNAAFVTHRPFLHSLAYRMTGSMADAEDLVQDCYLRWSQVPAGSVENPKAYLASAITRLSINHLQSARVRREKYTGPWLPEPVLTNDGPDSVELAESLTLAFLVLLESLSPAERAALLLAEVFGFDAEEMAPMLDKSAANCRQILHRARTAVAARRQRRQVDKQAVQPLLTEFSEAVQRGDVGRLIALMHEDAVVYSDGGGKVIAATQPVRGADRVARFLAGAAAKRSAGTHAAPAEINCQPGMIVWQGTEVYGTLVFDFEDGKIRTIYITANPDKLRAVREDLHVS